MDNKEFIITNDKVNELLELLYEQDKIYGAFIFGSRWRGDNLTEDSDYDIALFTDLDFFEVGELVDDFTPLCDVSDICDLPDNIQEDVIDSFDNILFLKEDYVINWERHMNYLLHEIRFRDDLRRLKGIDIYKEL